MAGIVHSIDELVGHTPLMELDRFERQQQCGAHLLAKLEFFNPTGSVKDRAALSMIQAAEASGHLAPGGTIVEQTSGNTGIGLAAFAAARGYKMEIFLERGASLERHPDPGVGTAGAGSKRSCINKAKGSRRGSFFVLQVLPTFSAPYYTPELRKYFPL